MPTAAGFVYAGEKPAKDAESAESVSAVAVVETYGTGPIIFGMRRCANESEKKTDMIS